MEGIKYGHVYVARHFYLEENVYKIGYTNGSVEERMNQLSTTGVPSKFYTVIER